MPRPFFRSARLLALVILRSIFLPSFTVAPRSLQKRILQPMPTIDGQLLATLGTADDGTFYDVDITAAITGNGTYSFETTLPAANTNTLGYASKEASAIANRRSGGEHGLCSDRISTMIPFPPS